MLKSYKETLWPFWILPVFLCIARKSRFTGFLSERLFEWRRSMTAISAFFYKRQYCIYMTFFVQIFKVFLQLRELTNKAHLSILQVHSMLYFFVQTKKSLARWISENPYSWLYCFSSVQVLDYIYKISF